MRFQVPQFIDVEDKIFGPMTFKQFIYLGGGIGLGFVLLKLLPKLLAWILIIPVAGLSLALAFYKMNGRPFIHTIESAFGYFFKSRLYLWRKEERKPQVKAPQALNYQKIALPNISENKLRDMSWSLDIKEGQNLREKDRQAAGKLDVK